MVTDELRRFAEVLADEARRVIRPYFRGRLDVEEKSDTSPVTRADREAELAMRALIERHHPGHGIVGEEHGSVNEDAEWRWVLDPIDGTKSFVLGVPLFATLIGLEHRGQPVLGVIDQPVLGERFVGDGERTTLNGDPVQIRPCARLEDAWLLTPDHRMVVDHQDAQRFDRLMRAVKCYRCIGDGYAYGMQAAGLVDVVVDPVMHHWDLSALIPVARGAGARITSWQGDDPVGATSSVAAHPAVHDAVLEALNG